MVSWGRIESHSLKLLRTKAFPPPDLADVLSTSSTVIGTKRKGLNVAQYPLPRICFLNALDILVPDPQILDNLSWS